MAVHEIVVEIRTKVVDWPTGIAISNAASMAKDLNNKLIHKLRVNAVW